ncbi:hypothetical protein F2Q68_00045736 [Brassica cretica]|uniref:Transmembrane protein 194 n=1 Tax=Brassica cretica TaxID=69181 RepID=A0A8S9LR92_BRACR|nr:hypothetical protein F2Q68_00045736 [Brassica cretica]
MASSSSSYLRLPHRISVLLHLIVFFLLSSLVTSDTEALKVLLIYVTGVGPGNSALSVNLTSCERIQVSGYPRTELGKYAHSFKVKLAPLVTLSERLHSKIQICVHRNASLGMCRCEKSDWKNLQKGQWSFVMSPYDTQYIDLKYTGQSSASVTISITEDFQQWRILCLVVGLVVIFAAPFVSSWLPFYYTSSMAVGVFLVVLIIIFQVMRLLPTGRKNVMYLAFYGSVVGAGSFILHQFSMMVDMILLFNVYISISLIKLLLLDSHTQVAILVLVGIAITGAAFGFWTVRKFVVSKDGGVDASVAQFVKWAMRSVAATFIFQSTMDTPLAMGAFLSASLLGYLLSRTIHSRKSVASQRQWLVPAGKGRPMQGRAEFLSRPGGGGLWNSARTVPSSTGSPSNGLKNVMARSSFNRRIPIERKDYYSTYHRTPNRKKLTKEEYEEVTRETTREAMAGLAASPGFSDWLIEHADRIKLLPDESYDDEMGSESDSTGEQSWTGFIW